MILQALHAYYERMSNADPDALAPDGWIDKGIDFIVEIRPDGTAAQLTCCQIIEKKKRRPGVAKRLPNIGKQSLKHNNSGKDANLLWDNASFALGMGADAAKKLDSFIATLDDWLHAIDDLALVSLRKFLDLLRADTEYRSQLMQAWASDLEILATGQPAIAFRLTGDDQLISDRPVVREAYLQRFGATSSGVVGNCLLTGAVNVPIQVSHPVIKNVWNTQTAGASIVSFNERAFESYGKVERKGENAPVSEEAAAAYTKALNHLLAAGSRQRMQVGDASTVFWAQAQEDADVENGFAALFGDAVDDPNAHTEQVRALFEAVHSGRFDGSAGKRRFYVLGLAPNAARIAIRFWHDASLNELSSRIGAWFYDIEISRSPHEPEFQNVRRLLTSACLATRDRPHGDIQRLPPAIAGDLVRCILDGTELPNLLVNAVLERCRAEQAKKDDQTGKPVRHVSQPRAALLRVFVNRYRRFHQPEAREITVSLDKEFPDPAYALGRLFAVFERMQEVAAGRDLNKTIRDAYFGAAMSTPRAVFPRLNRLNQVHLRDIKRSSPGYAVFFERLTLEINNKINPREMYPAVFPMRDQSLFALGYYHQRQAFFTKSEADEPTASAPPAATGSVDTPAQASLI
jgi:CRISPR-associated protein Csd1